VGGVRARIDSVSQSHPARTRLGGLPVSSFETGGADLEARKASYQQLGGEGAATDVSVADHEHAPNRRVEPGSPGSRPPPFVDRIVPVLEDQQGAADAAQPGGSEADEGVARVLECHGILDASG
jgi:hypothetical protein